MFNDAQLKHIITMPRYQVPLVLILILYNSSVELVNSISCSTSDHPDNDPLYGTGTSTDTTSSNRATLSDTRVDDETFYTSLAGSVTASTSGILSTLASFTMIYLITQKSEMGLSSVYHRIMAGMSIADILSAVAFSISSLPLPKDMIYEQFKGLTIGNSLTCGMQGFAQLFGIMWQMNYTAVLSLYYLFTIRYKKREQEIAKRNERVWHILALLLAIPIPVWGLKLGYFNPTPYEAWCTLAAVPWYCDPNRKESEECMIAGDTTFAVILYTVLIHGFVIFLLTICSMMLIIRYVYMQEQYIREAARRYNQMTLNRSDPNLFPSVQRRHNLTKSLSVQASAYIITFLLVPLSGLVHLFQTNGTQPWFFQIFHVIARPLQGCCTLIIFVGAKAYDNRRIEPNITLKASIAKVFTQREERRIIVSGISLVRVHDPDDDENGGMMLYYDGADDVESTPQEHYMRRNTTEQGMHDVTTSNSNGDQSSPNVSSVEHDEDIEDDSSKVGEYSNNADVNSSSRSGNIADADSNSRSGSIADVNSISRSNAASRAPLSITPGSRIHSIHQLYQPSSIISSTCDTLSFDISNVDVSVTGISTDETEKEDEKDKKPSRFSLPRAMTRPGKQKHPSSLQGNDGTINRMELLFARNVENNTSVEGDAFLCDAHSSSDT